MNVLVSMVESVKGQRVVTIATGLQNSGVLPLGSKGIIIQSVDICPMSFEVWFPELRETYHVMAEALEIV